MLKHGFGAVFGIQPSHKATMSPNSAAAPHAAPTLAATTDDSEPKPPIPSRLLVLRCFGERYRPRRLRALILRRCAADPLIRSLLEMLPIVG